MLDQSEKQNIHHSIDHTVAFYFVYIFTNSDVEMYIFASQSLHLIDREHIYFTNWYTLIRKCRNLLNSRFRCSMHNSLSYQILHR